MTDKMTDHDHSTDPAALTAAAPEQPNDHDEQQKVDNVDVDSLRASLEANAYQYELHVALINALRSTGDTQGVRSAREAMHAVFPLSEGLWVDWINDEIQLATEEAEKRAILDLFSRAVDDYLCEYNGEHPRKSSAWATGYWGQTIKLWKGYAKFAIHGYEGIGKVPLLKHGEDEDDDDEEEEDEDEEKIEEMEVEQAERWATLDDVRGICARAINATGLHFAKGHLVWNLYRDFEVRLLEKEITSEYSSFETRFDNQHYEQRLKSANAVYAKAKADSLAREPFERTLTETSNSLDAFLSYIDFENSSPSSTSGGSNSSSSTANSGVDKRRIRTLFERAVVVHCLDPRVWDAYLIFMEAFGKSRDEVQEVYYRGLGFIATGASGTGSGDDSSAAIEGVIKILQAWCQYEKRCIDWNGVVTDVDAERLRKSFEDAIEYVQQTFPPGDPYFRLEQSLIRLETYALKSIPRARKLFEKIIQQDGSQSEMWIKFIEFE
ncbi:Squamous cell carcinoma antigen recognized by T-cells 3, partial [Quaeritorhiza haematococci]